LSFILRWTAKKQHKKWKYMGKKVKITLNFLFFLYFFKNICRNVVKGVEI